MSRRMADLSNTGLAVALRRRLRSLRAARDTGLSLIELVVATTIMGLFLAMFTVGTQQMFETANGNEARSAAQSQLNNMFLRLDKEIRYASAVSDPGTVGDNAYVEYLMTNNGEKTCIQLRLNKAAKQLQRRTWAQGSDPVNPTPWMPLASDLTASQPFTTHQAGGTFAFQRLQLKLTATSGGVANARSALLDITFTAWNTSLSTSSKTVCTEGRSIA